MTAGRMARAESKDCTVHRHLVERICIDDRRPRSAAVVCPVKADTRPPSTATILGSQYGERWIPTAAAVGTAAVVAHGLGRRHVG
jgi:hypothetical protein